MATKKDTAKKSSANKTVLPEKKVSSKSKKGSAICSTKTLKKNKNPNSTKKPKFYDVENVAVSYAHNKEFHRDYNVQKYINENVTASASYNFNFTSKPNYYKTITMCHSSSI